MIIVQWNFQICCSKCTCYLTLPLKPKYHNLYFIIYDIGYILHLNIFSFARKKFFANPNHKKWAPHKLILYILFPIELQLHEWIIILFQQLCMMMMNQFFKKKFLKLSLKFLLQWLLDLHIVWNRGKFVQQSKNHIAEDLIILKHYTVQSYLNLPKSLCLYSKLCSTKQWSSRTYFTLLLWKPIFSPKRVLLVGTILCFIWQTFNFYSKSGIKVNIYLVLFQKYLVSGSPKYIQFQSS